MPDSNKKLGVFALAALVVSAMIGAAEISAFSDFLHITVFVLLLQSRAAVEDICAPTVSAFSAESMGRAEWEELV